MPISSITKSFVPPQSVTLGPFEIYLYSIFILVGIAAGYYLAKPAARKYRISAETLQLSIFYGVIPGLIGARLYHVVDYWDHYLVQPAEIIAIWNGGLGIIGGLLGGALGLAFFAKRRGIRLLRLLDVWAPSVLLAQAIGRLGNWTNQEAFGRPTDLPWGVYIEPANRPPEHIAANYFHPTFFYEAAFDLVGVLALVLLRNRLGGPGQILGAYLIWYGAGRFIAEFFRIDTAQIGGIHLAQLVAVMLIAGGIYLVTRRRR